VRSLERQLLKRDRKIRSLEHQLLKRNLKIRNLKQNQRLLKKRIRKLERQLQSMRSSRSWRLLNKLGGIRARVSKGRKR
jgi:predicted  nucleic acid-binding Zn-ribbon protein